MVGCSVGPCKGGNTGKSEFQSFTFPKGAMREKWIQQINRENFVPGEYSTVCERHFQERDFGPNKDKRGRKYKKKKLKPWAYPTLNLLPVKESEKKTTKKVLLVSNGDCTKIYFSNVHQPKLEDLDDNIENIPSSNKSTNELKTGNFRFSP